MSSIEEIEINEEIPYEDLSCFDLHDESPLDNAPSLDNDEVSLDNDNGNDNDNDKDSLQTIEEEDNGDYGAPNPFLFDDSDESDKECARSKEQEKAQGLVRNEEQLLRRLKYQQTDNMKQGCGDT